MKNVRPILLCAVLLIFASPALAQSASEVTSDQYADEEVSSHYGYPSGYQPTDVASQVATLRTLFPELAEATYDKHVATKQLPPHAEGWFAIPRWQSVAPTYGKAVEKVFSVLNKTRNGDFYNYHEGRLGPTYLRQREKTQRMWETLADGQTGHDILIVPAQFGKRHAGRSVRRAREVMNPNEFGLGTFAIGVMLLTHPERLGHYVWIDAAGDDYTSAADGAFSLAPGFIFVDGLVGFGARWCDDALDFFGSVSAFLSQ